MKENKNKYLIGIFILINLNLILVNTQRVKRKINGAEVFQKSFGNNDETNQAEEKMEIPIEGQNNIEVQEEKENNSEGENNEEEEDSIQEEESESNQQQNVEDVKDEEKKEMNNKEEVVNNEENEKKEEIYNDNKEGINDKIDDKEDEKNKNGGGEEQNEEENKEEDVKQKEDKGEKEENENEQKKIKGEEKKEDENKEEKVEEKKDEDDEKKNEEINLSNNSNVYNGTVNVNNTVKGTEEHKPSEHAMKQKGTFWQSLTCLLIRFNCPDKKQKEKINEINGEDELGSLEKKYELSGEEKDDPVENILNIGKNNIFKGIQNVNATMKFGATFIKSEVDESGKQHSNITHFDAVMHN